MGSRVHSCLFLSGVFLLVEHLNLNLVVLEALYFKKQSTLLSIVISEVVLAISLIGQQQGQGGLEVVVTQVPVQPHHGSQDQAIFASYLST